MAFLDQIVISEICTLGSMCAQETVADHEQQSMAWVMAVFLMGFSPLYEQSYNLRVPCSVPLSSFNALYCNMYLLFLYFCTILFGCLESQGHQIPKRFPFP